MTTTSVRLTNTPTTSTPMAPTTPTTGTPALSKLYSPSAAARTFLAGLHLSFGSGPLTGTLVGHVLTVAISAPVLPIALPIGGQSISFTGATLTIDESTDTLTVAASVAASGGIGGTLTVSIAHASTTTLTATTTTHHTDLSATVDITGVSLFGARVELVGTLGYTAGKPTAALTGTLTSDTVIAAGILTLSAGTTVTLSTATGLMLAGSAVLGSGSAAFTVAVTGAVTDLKNWSLSVNDATNAPSFSPVSGLTISPSLSGTIMDTKGTVTFDVSSDDVASWTVGGATMALHHIEVSDQATPAGLSCPATKDGQLWFDIQGTLTDSVVGASATAQACIAPAARAFTITTTAPSSLLPGSQGFSISGASLRVDGKLANAATGAAASVSITASGTLTTTAGLPHPFSQQVAISLSSDGSFIASSTVDLATLGLGATGSTGTLLLSSAKVKNFDPTTVGSTGNPFTLPAGITVLLAYTPTADVKQALSSLKLPVPTAITARASLSSTGFSATIDLPFGPGTSGVLLLGRDSLGGGAAYVNDLTLGIKLSATSGTLTVGGSAYLVLPPLYPGSSGSQVEVTLSGSLRLTATAVSVSIGFDFAGVSGPWTDAFGIPGLSVDELAGQIGVEDSEETLGIPTPTFSFLVNNLVLPTTWAKAIGMLPGTMVSLSLALDLANPIAAISISGPTPGAVALEPFSVVNDVPGLTNYVPQSVVTAVQLNTAQLLFAPFGGTDAAGNAVNPGATLVFDAVIAGQQAHVDAAIGLLPYPSFTADVSVSSFAVGPISLNGPKMAITMKADPTNPVADVSFSGGFTDSFTGTSFNATIDEGLSMSLAHASVSLQIVAGQPQYIQAGANLQGSVTVDGSGASFAASGAANLVIGGQQLGSVQFSYSTTSGALWQQLQDNAALVTAAFKNAYGWSDATAASILRSLQFSTDQISWGLTYAYNDSVAQLTTVLYQGGVGIGTAISEARNWVGATDVQIAGALQQLGFDPNSIAGQLQNAFGDGDRRVTAVFNQLGYSASDIGSVLQNVYGDGQAAVYNSLQSVGAAGSSAIDQLSGLFNSGAYSLSTHPWYSVPLLMDVAGGSTDPGATVLQWVWDGGHNQQWYVLPTDSGYAELVNRNSGQCLSVDGGSGSAGAGLVQQPCTGDPVQQWYLNVYQGNSDIMGQTKILANRGTGLVADVAGKSTTDGGTIDQWYENDDWNQTWYFGPAVG
ncbi:RICIN domain-containing protein [Nakamurella sp. PAMC28650]|uniref:RICIN domain-containing protein n=1 Tax=Nakamurella sp. PAMC28650 TaxID=2762325 RepID=UPI00164E483B|nr:RICIN domain-containing protein [Nakamurella sp. PAMC28650]QNK82884.1 RICIN domain-containing protein [Nakamurella sp. PAMC28650]